MESVVHLARALVLHDLQHTSTADAETVSLLEDVLVNRQWWVQQWPQGGLYLAGLVAQDVQDLLLDRFGRWPLCYVCDGESPHAVYIHPELGGPDPVWVCEESGVTVAPLGKL